MHFFREWCWYVNIGSHYGLLSIQLLFLETDINFNPLRTNLFDEGLNIENGKIKLNDAHGIGGKLNFDTIHKYLISSNT